MEDFTIRGILSLFLLAIVLAAGGCSSDDDDGANENMMTLEMVESTTTTTQAPSELTAEEYGAAFVESLAEAPADGPLVVSREQAECLGPKYVEAITVETLQANDVTLEEAADPAFDVSELGLDDSQGEAMIDAFAPCGVDVLEKTALFLRPLTDEQLQCVVDNLDPEDTTDLWVQAFVATLAEGQFDDLVQPAKEACDLPAS